MTTISATDTDFAPTLPSLSNFGAGDLAFANTDNLDNCARYINRTLVTSGLPASLDLFATDPVSIARTCNCIYALLQQRQHDSDFRESVNEQRQRFLSDMSRAEAKVERLESQLLCKERDIATIIRTEAKTTSAYKAQIEKLQQERDEFQKMVFGSQQVKTQLIHEMKKKEKEYVKLQERLNQVLTEKNKESRPGIEIMSLLQKEGRQRGTWGSSKKIDEELFKKIVQACDAKNQELMAENADLRAMLRLVQNDMRDFLNAPNGISRKSNMGDVKQGPSFSKSVSGGQMDVFELPLHLARNQIEDSLMNKMLSIKEHMARLGGVTSADGNRQLDSD